MKKNIKQELTNAALITALLFAAYIFPHQKNYPCYNSATLALTAMHFGYGYFATAQRPDSSTLSLYISPSARDWIIVSSDFDMHSCITDQGHDWTWMLED